jgi:DNA-directed RNA polymerase specialized sigma24 family protein
VDRERALAELPVAYAVALRLRAAGADDQTIAAALGIDPAGVPALLEVAEAKLSAEMARDPGR